MANKMRFKVTSILLVFLAISGWAAVRIQKDSTQKSKAAFLDEQQLSFIRPGLVLNILSATVDADGTVRYQFKITDPQGLPLDREGIVTPGPVNISSLLGYIPRGQGIYTSYITRTQTSPTGVSAIQADDDSGGTFTKISDGVYEYRFNTKLPTGYDRTATHTVGAWASRDLSEFELSNSLAAKTFNFVPAGSAVTETRQITSNQKCDSCHGTPLVFHGSRTTVEVCIMCHTPQTTDPDSGNTVDFTTMVHKIHQGSGLPSVMAGKPYVIIGNNQSVHDYSTVIFPADVRNCAVCHLEGATGNQHLTNPSRRACGSCHDDVNFATGENHASLPQVSDNQCRQCHVPEGELEFDVSIKGAHTVEMFSKSLPGVKFQIFGIQNTAPGQSPAVTFDVTDKSDKPLAPSVTGQAGSGTRRTGGFKGRQRALHQRRCSGGLGGLRTDGTPINSRLRFRKMRN